MLPWTTEKDRILRRHAVYMRERMQLPISDPQYLFWDGVFSDRFDTALEKYHALIFKYTNWDDHGCMNTGEIPRLRITFAKKTLLSYRFTFAVATVIPLSSNEVIRHECNNEFCINPRHLMVGDQRQNFEDYVAEQAYGTRWELLDGYTPQKSNNLLHLSHPEDQDIELIEDNPGD